MDRLLARDLTNICWNSNDAWWWKSQIREIVGEKSEKKENRRVTSDWSTREGRRGVYVCVWQLSLSDGGIDKVLVWCAFGPSLVSSRVKLLSVVLEEQIATASGWSFYWTQEWSW